MTRAVATRAGQVLLVALLAAPGGAQQAPPPAATARVDRGGRFWSAFVAGFGTSILSHEAAHIAAAYAVGGRPTFGLDAGRPTVYSGIDASRQPREQFIFSSSGLTVQSLIDEAILDSPHAEHAPSGAFERGVLAGGVATALFYATVGRNGTVSDVDYMSRTSSLSKTTIGAIYGGIALLHAWRITRSERYAHFFVRPDARAGLRVGFSALP